MKILNGRAVMQDGFISFMIMVILQRKLARYILEELMM